MSKLEKSKLTEAQKSLLIRPSKSSFGGVGLLIAAMPIISFLGIIKLIGYFDSKLNFDRTFEITTEIHSAQCKHIGKSCGSSTPEYERLLLNTGTYTYMMHGLSKKACANAVKRVNANNKVTIWHYNGEIYQLKIGGKMHFTFEYMVKIRPRFVW